MRAFFLDEELAVWRVDDGAALLLALESRLL
jgi:hypothetical protein